ncbi:hypothetical protein FOA52_001563 [Chlamydomonas sp. UWO 241]|nr:hypothetical protein FOA52_001563 [Chlamydomonas sp. UWO 241]
MPVVRMEQHNDDVFEEEAAEEEAEEGEEQGEAEASTSGSEEEGSDSDDGEGWQTAEEESDGLEGPAESYPPGSAEAKLRAGQGKFGCDHYRRRCRLIAPCCGEPFWCRHCHNAVHQDGQQDPQKRHTLDRKAVTELICAQCDTRQPVSATCVNCEAAFGRYTCLRCNFFDDDLSKLQYHCDECGICRVGGREHYFHCQTCNCCYATSLRDSHVCIENSMHHNCPVCFEYLFESIKPINVMPCGHTIHQACLQELADHSSYICPVCNKTYVNGGNMARLWSNMDAAVAQTPMPAEYADMRVQVLCNDCNLQFETTFHLSPG